MCCTYCVWQLGRVEELLTALATRLGAEPPPAAPAPAAALSPTSEEPAAALARKRRSKVA